MSEWNEDEILGKAYDARLMRRFLGYLRPHRALVVAAILAVFVKTGCDLAGPFLVRRAVDGPIAGKDPGGLLAITLAFLASVAGMALFEYLQTLTTNLGGQRIIRDLRMQLFRHLQSVPQAFNDRTPVGRLVTRISNDVENINELFTSGVIAFFSDLLMLIGVVVAMFVMSWRLALVTMAIMPAILAAALLFRRYARERYRQMRERIAKINSWLNESVNGIRTIQMFTREEASARKWEACNRDYRESAVGAIFVYSLFFPAVELLSSIAVGLLIWYGGGAMLQGSLSLGDFMGFWYFAQKLFQPVRELSEKYNILQAAMASCERIFGLLDEPPASISGTKPAGGIRGAIAFEDVHFSYDGTTPVLQGVSFRVEPGQTLAIVGATGAGKSTIINLLLRLYDVTKGRITLDGTDLRDIAPGSLRRSMALVLQDVFLFTGTIEENIRLGRALDPKVVEEAAKTANAHRFIDRLPLKYGTAVGERGMSLSTGERQLLSFARALAADPRILILDEATSSVDSESEALIQEALGRLLKGRTSIVIAHRLSTIRRADCILVIEDGRIAESGRHEELIKADGLYAALHRVQLATP